MVRRFLLGVLFCAMSASGAIASPPTHWIHIDVNEPGENGDRVRINLPLRFVASVLPAIRTEGLDGGVIRVGDIHKGDVDLDLPALVKALREAEDGEFVTVEGKDETVRIQKSGEKILVHVDDRGGHGESVEIEMRMKVLDALLSAGPDELNLLAAVDALEAQGESELVRVRDGEETVRIWIDKKSTID